MTAWGALAAMAAALGTGSAALAQPSDAEITEMIDDTVAVCRPQYEAVMRLGRSEGASDRDIRFRIAQFQYEINQAPPIQLQPRNAQTRQMFGNEVTDLLDCMTARQVALRGGAPRQSTEGPLGLRGMPVPSSAPAQSGQAQSGQGPAGQSARNAPAGANQANQSAKPKAEEQDPGLYWLRGRVDIPGAIEAKCRDKRVCLEGLVGFRVEVDEPPIYWTGGFSFSLSQSQLFGQTPLRPGTSYTVIKTNEGPYWTCDLVSNPRGRTPSGPTEPNASREIDAIRFACDLTEQGRKELERLEAGLAP